MTFQLILLLSNEEDEVLENFPAKLPKRSRSIDRVNKCCISIITKPTPNSTAEKIKKKKVRDRKFKLS